MIKSFITKDDSPSLPQSYENELTKRTICHNMKRGELLLGPRSSIQCSTSDAAVRSGCVQWERFRETLTRQCRDYNRHHRWGWITSLDSAAKWLSKTCYYQRIRKSIKCFRATGFGPAFFDITRPQLGVEQHLLVCITSQLVSGMHVWSCSRQ